MFRIWALGLALLLSAPVAAAAVTLDRIEVPERTMAGKAFPASVEITNDGPARDVHLLAALYAEEPGAAPCGPATDPRFRGFTHLLQETIQLPARATLRYPTSGDWLQRYDREDVGAAPATGEFCVFLVNASSTVAIQYEAFARTSIEVRGENALPRARFDWAPVAPGATEDVRFDATAEDADGDPVSFRWDFGHLNATGRASAEGDSPTTFFYPAGDFVVTLFASDGLEETRVTRTITVMAGPSPAPDPETRGPLGTPIPPFVALMAITLAAMLVVPRKR